MLVYNSSYYNNTFDLLLIMNVLYPVSPARTPSKNPNVERLLSLQKSSKHISDADILSFAAEASAMKRMEKASITDVSY